MKTNDLALKARDGHPLSHAELVFLLNLPPDCPESYLVMAEANRISKELSGNQAEVHAQLALNLAPCPCNCLFCSFAAKNDVFRKETRLTVEQAVEYAKRFEADGANAVYLMTTARYPFGRFLEVSQEVRRALKPETTMIANIGDQTEANARKMKDAGYAGVYHAMRLREGVDSELNPEARAESIRNFKESGLLVGTCVEPVGPEHTPEELAEMILFTASVLPAFSGAARRIPIPGTRMADRGSISELRMAQIVAVTRLAMPRSVAGNCTHEPCTLGGIAGANLFWAEVGANPRDVAEKTEEGRGESVQGCRTIFRECGWDFHEGSSRFFAPPC
jgi:biotin synthase